MRHLLYIPIKYSREHTCNQRLEYDNVESDYEAVGRTDTNMKWSRWLGVFCRQCKDWILHDVVHHEESLRDFSDYCEYQ